MLRCFRIVLLSCAILGQFGFCETSHSLGDRTGRSADLTLVEKVLFQVQFQNELLASAIDPVLSLQIEYGGIPDSKGEKQKAIRVYRGQKGRPTGELEIIAMQAGKARTLIAAKKACEKLVPLGQWRLATVPEMMAFFIDLAPTFPLPQNPNKKGYLFWASSGDEVKDKANKETFFSSWQGDDSKLESHQFSNFVTNVRTTIARAKSQEEKNYYIELLKKTREGLPAVCVIGN